MSTHPVKHVYIKYRLKNDKITLQVKGKPTNEKKKRDNFVISSINMTWTCLVGQVSANVCNKCGNIGICWLLTILNSIGLKDKIKIN